MIMSVASGARNPRSCSPSSALSLLAIILILGGAPSIQACGGGGGFRLADSLELVPADAQYVGVIDVEQILAGDVPSVVADQIEDDWEEEFEDIGVFPDELTTYVFAYGEDWFLVVLEGEFDFEQIRDDLDDGDYDDDRYRGYEIWERVAWPNESVALALVEDRGWVVTGGADIVKDVLRLLDRGSGSLLDDADSDLGRSLKQAGKGWMVSAGAGEEGCLEFELQDCRAVGVSLRSGYEDYLVEATVAALFRSERTAESEMDNLEEAIEDSFEGDIIEVRLEGEFVIVTASLEEDEFVGSASPDTGADTPAAPAAPTPSAIASFIGDDHGDSADHATFATVGRPVPGEINYQGDVDFFAFTAERGKTYQIDVGLGTLGDSVATLYDSDGWALEFNDDHGGFWASRIIWTATESTVHHVAVEGYGTGSYTLTIAESDAMPMATPNRTAIAAPTPTAVPTATPSPTATAVPEYACSGGADPTPLHRAVSQTNLEVVRILADRCSEDINFVSDEYSYQQTPLSLAIGNGHEEIVRALVAAGADPGVEVSPDFRVGTHLTYAVGLGDAEIVQILLDAGADPNVVDTEQFYEESPLSIAVKAKHVGMVRVLVNVGADPNKRLDQFNKVSPLDIAIEEGYTDIVRILTGTPNGSEAEASPETEASPAFSCSGGADPTPLHRAVSQTNLEVVRILADRCSEDLNFVSDEYPYQQTPLSLAIGKGHEEIVRALVAAGADPDVEVSPDFRVGTHLTYAVGLGNAEIVQILLDAGADPDVVDAEQFYEQTPLSLAIGSGRADLLRKLIAAGADPAVEVSPDFRVGTHLTYAVGLGDTEIVQILLDAGADPNVVDTEQFYEESPLSIAVKAEDVEMVRVLVDAGADPNKRLDQFNEVSPLDIAIEEGYTDIVQILTGTPG